MATVPSAEVVEEEFPEFKPPFLRRVRVRGYKSIAFCDVTLEPLTILVGRNASGKSNFLDALAFLRDLMEMTVTEAVNARKGWRAVHSRTTSFPFIDLEISGTFESSQTVWEADYSFSLELAERNQIRVREESLTLSERGRDRRCGYRASEGGLEWIGHEHFADGSEWTSQVRIGPASHDGKLDDPRLIGPRRRFDRLLLSVIGTQPFLDFAEGLRASRVYNFQPLAIRTHQPTTASPILAQDGANLARAIEALREIEPETIERIGQYLEYVVPSVVGFRTQEYGDFETVRFTVNGDEGKPQEFDASSISDGTLRVLAVLVSAFQIVLPGGYPGFIGIEEPDTALHPAAMRALVDALDEASLRTQILLTTHNADLLESSLIKPENVRVVQFTDGKTVIGPVDACYVEIVAQKWNTLGGLERENQLEPDLDDQGRQRDLAEKQETPP